MRKLLLNLKKSRMPIIKLDFRMKNLVNIFLCSLFLISGGCSLYTQNDLYDDWDFSTPTRDGSIVQAKVLTPTQTITQSPTVVAATAKITQPETLNKSIYSEDLNPNWALMSSNYDEINLRSQAESYEGLLSIAIIPSKAFSRIDFVVKEITKERYPRSRILGIRLWINPEDYDLSPSDLGLILLGSNEYSYYVKGDQSVSNSDNSVSTETRLDNLGYNQPIPANTWTELTIWLENLNDERAYENIVGFSVINDSGFLQTIYIDKVELILAAGEVIPTREPTSTWTVTPIPTDTPTITPTPTATATPTQNIITPYRTPTPTSTRKPREPKPTKEPTLAPSPP